MRELTVKQTLALFRRGKSDTVEFKKTTAHNDLACPQKTTPATEQAVPPSHQSSPQQYRYNPQYLPRSINAIGLVMHRSNSKNGNHFRSAMLGAATHNGLITPTLPDRPGSRFQKYKLAKKEKSLLPRLKDCHE